MNQATLAWAAFKNMMRQAARDPLWAFLSLLALPFRIWKPLLGLLFILIITLFVVGFGGRFFLEQMGFGPGSVPFIALDLVTLLVLAAITFRLVTNPLIIHFGDMDGETHGSARFATDKETAALARADSGLLIGRDGKTGKLLRYDGPAHLLTMAPTRTGKGVGTIIPNLLTADRSVICIDPKGENAKIAGHARQTFGPVHVLDPFGVTGQPSAAFNLSTSSTRPASMSRKMQAPWPTPSCSMNRAWPARRIGTRKPRRSLPA
ncbi:type IV secretory system conjugative DNA transfer family protein [Ochrobactrum grignonense]|nr:type IV secretory system conjugative DNA transfer family protein [Brucella grignonensis]